VFIFNY